MGMTPPNDAVMNNTGDVYGEVTLMKRQQGWTGKADLKLISFGFGASW